MNDDDKRYMCSEYYNAQFQQECWWLFKIICNKKSGARTEILETELLYSRSTEKHKSMDKMEDIALTIT